VSDRGRQLVLLGVLLAALVWVVSRQLASAPAGGGGRPAARRPGGAVTASADGPIEIAELRLDALEHKPANYSPGRDPFRFAPKRAPRPKPAKPRPAPARPAAPPPREPRPAPAAQPQPQPPPIDFVYLGSFGVPGRQIAVFSDGKEILNAFAGDVLQREFVVRNIGFESADIGFVNFPDAPAKRLAVGG
jgi:hypothetical protein